MPLPSASARATDRVKPGAPGRMRQGRECAVNDPARWTALPADPIGPRNRAPAASPVPGRRQKMSQSSSPPGGGATGLIVVLGMLAAFGPMSIDMYLPSFPAIAAGLATDAGRVQLTLSTFFAGFAAGQLVYGPLSDRLGRRPVLLVGIVLYVAASAACAVAAGIEQLIAFRLLQALGGGAGTVIARAIVRDHFDTDHGARVMSLMMLVTGLAPLLAPLVGGQVQALAGWRAVFWVLTGFGAVCLAAVLLRLPESNPAARRAGGARGLAPILAGYAGVLRSPVAVGNIAAGGFAFAGMFAYIAGTPFVYIELFGVPPQAYGLLFGLNVVGMMTGSLLNSRLVLGRGAAPMMRLGLAVACAGGLVLLATAATGASGLVGIVVPLFFYVGLLGLIASNAMARASRPFPAHAGTVAALFGCAQFGLGALAAVAVGALHDGTPLPMAAVIAACGVVAFVAERWAARAERRAAAAAPSGR